MSIGVIVIGRNEGERLRRCLLSVLAAGGQRVYVDSGSQDGSPELARALGTEVVELDLARPFTAARARNEGFRRLVELAPDVEHVQFVDGDCEIVPGWFDAAMATLQAQPDLAIVAGRVRERHPEASVYNRLGDLEWNVDGAGEVQAVGGIFMVRRRAFEGVGGFDATVAAGEEPELCQRLIRQEWRVLRLDQAMAWHDLAMTRFGQWWRRQVRNGYGGLDVVRRFGLARYRRSLWRVRFWSAWPLLVIAAAVGVDAVAGRLLGALAATAACALWPFQCTRIALRTRQQGHALSLSMAHAFFTMVSYWPQMLGQMRYLMDRSVGRSLRLIEYKEAAVQGAHERPKPVQMESS